MFYRGPIMFLLLLLALSVNVAGSQSSYRDYMCRIHGEDMTRCKLKCSDGYARPLGCDTCTCKESLCSSKEIKCAKGSHCEVQTQGQAFFPIDVAACVADAATSTTTSTTTTTTTTTPTTTTSTSTSTTTTTTTTPTTTTKRTTTTPATVPTTTQTTTTTKTTRTTPRRSGIAMTTAKTIPTTTTTTAKESIDNANTEDFTTCEQRGRCDQGRTCDDPTYVCRSDGRCCRSDDTRPDQDSDVPRCQQVPSVGMCRVYSRQYVYDIDIGQCVETVFGGCAPSGNSFLSMAECEEMCEKPCQQPESDGPCRANVPRYYFDLTVKKCLIFDYGGCNGNTNNFVTEEACNLQCSGLATPGESRYSSYRDAVNNSLIYPEFPSELDQEGNISGDTDSSTTGSNSGNPFKGNSNNNNGESASGTGHGGSSANVTDTPNLGASGNNDQDSTVHSSGHDSENDDGNTKPPYNKQLGAVLESGVLNNLNKLPFGGENSEDNAQKTTTEQTTKGSGGGAVKKSSKPSTMNLSDFLAFYFGRYRK